MQKVPFSFNLEIISKMTEKFEVVLSWRGYFEPRFWVNCDIFDRVWRLLKFCPDNYYF